MLTSSETARIKHECGANQLASPYSTAIFDTIIVPNLTAEGETIVRDLLTKIDTVKAEMAASTGTGTIKGVDEISCHSAGTLTEFAALTKQINYWRMELRAAIGLAMDAQLQLGNY